LICNSSCRRNV